MYSHDIPFVQYAENLPREATVECFYKIFTAWRMVKERAISREVKTRADKEMRAAQRVTNTLARTPVLPHL